MKSINHRTKLITESRHQTTFQSKQTINRKEVYGTSNSHTNFIPDPRFIHRKKKCTDLDLKNFVSNGINRPNRKKNSRSNLNHEDKTLNLSEIIKINNPRTKTTKNSRNQNSRLKRAEQKRHPLKQSFPGSNKNLQFLGDIKSKSPEISIPIDII